MRATILVIACLALAARAEDSLPKQAIPYSKLPFADVQTAKLPKLLRDALLATDEFSQGTDKLPDTLRVCRIDLNDDGSPEFIVDSRQSYSGGTAHVVFERHRNSYEQIAYFQGGFYFGPRVHGYYQICADPLGQRSGYVLYVLRYSDGQYHEHYLSRNDQ